MMHISIILRTFLHRLCTTLKCTIPRPWDPQKPCHRHESTHELTLSLQSVWARFRGVVSGDEWSALDGWWARVLVAWMVRSAPWVGRLVLAVVGYGRWAMVTSGGCWVLSTWCWCLVALGACEALGGDVSSNSSQRQ